MFVYTFKTNLFIKKETKMKVLIIYCILLLQLNALEISKQKTTQETGWFLIIQNVKRR